MLPLTAALNSLDEKCITVSFDDGDSTTCTVAQSILDGRGIRAMLYLSTDYVVQGTTYNSRRPLRAVTWLQLGRWLEAGHEIGSHTNRHKSLTKCSDEEVLEELLTSKQTVKRELGVEIRHFAYPWGQHDERTRLLFDRQQDWASAATIERGINTNGTDKFRLKRELVDPSMSLAAAYLKLAVGRLKTSLCSVSGR